MQRAEQELNMLEQVSQILGDGLELSQVFQRVMTLLSEQLNMKSASLVLFDETIEQFRIIAAVGLTPEEIARGRYASGEGVTGQVLETGKPQIIPDVTQHPGFLDRTKSRAHAGQNPLSFICVPVKDADRFVGAISADMPATDEQTLHANARLLAIIAGSIAQTSKIHHLVQLEKDHWLEENQRLRDDLFKRYKFDNIIGTSPVMLEVLTTIGQVASSRATCLILGETGCGKELVAKAVHYNSPRRDKPLIRVNCGALNQQLLESELFGHVKGSFTGAVRDKIGRFEAADGGTIFLDEIGTLDPELQVRLLRVLQEREFERVGDHQSIKIDVRVIAATNLNLEDEVRKRTFREDLYYRLNVVTIDLPPLRTRREDIPRLIDFFLDKFNRENNRSLKTISRDMLNTLLRYPWPGNVRELENAVERAVVLCTSEQFTEDLLPLQIRMYAQQVRTNAADESIETLASKLASHAIEEFKVYDGEVYDMTVNELERHLIREALELNNDVKTRTADFLGINRNTLNKKIKELQIPDLQ